MSPGGGAANLGLFRTVRSRTLADTSCAACAPFTLRRSPLSRRKPGARAPCAPLYPAIVPVQQQFSRPPSRPQDPVRRCFPPNPPFLRASGKPATSTTSQGWWMSWRRR